MRFSAIAVLCLSLFAPPVLADEFPCLPEAEGVAMIERIADLHDLRSVKLEGSEAQAFLDVINEIPPVTEFRSRLIIAILSPSDKTVRFTTLQACGIPMGAMILPMSVFDHAYQIAHGKIS